MLRAALITTMVVVETQDRRYASAMPNPASDAARSSVIRVKLSVGSVPEVSFSISGTYHTPAGALVPGSYTVRNLNKRLQLINSSGTKVYESLNSLMITENQNPSSTAVNLITMTVGTTKKFQGSMKFFANGVYGGCHQSSLSREVSLWRRSL
jgi:outer membrane translocation and assembly module TamA